MKIKFSVSIEVFAVIVGAMLCADISLSQTVNIVQVYKNITYVQTNATMAYVGPPPSGSTNGGPYGFQADVVGTNIGEISPPGLTLPPGSTFDDPGNFDGYLAYNPDGYNFYGPMWAFGLGDATDWGTTSQAENDSLFANGTYTFVVQGTTIPLNLTGNAYPNIPIAILSGGYWSGGQYVMDATNALTITSSTFTNYASHVDGRIMIGTIDSLAEAWHSSAPSSNSMTYVMPPNTLTPGQSYPLSFGIAFDSFVDTNADLAGSYNCAYYEQVTAFSVVTIPHVRFQSENAQTLKIGFSGVIQQSSDLKNWVDVNPQPTSPWLVPVSSGTCFFRVRNN